MRVLVILAIAASCSGQIITPYQYVPTLPVAIKYQGVDPFGQTTFGHQSIEQTRHEVRLADGRVVGSFSYIDPNGDPAITYFEAGPNVGYRVLGSNILPEAPTADLIAPANDAVGPAYTPEVEQARAEFQKLYAEAAAAAAAAPDDVAIPAEPTYAAAETPAAEEPAAPAAEEPAAVEAVRRKREVKKIPLPYLQPVPTEVKHTYETTQLEPVKAATPADTTKIELTKKEHEITLPGIKYVQPFAEVKPLQYTVLAPQAGLPIQPYFYPGFAYPTLLSATPAPAVAEE